MKFLLLLMAVSITSLVSGQTTLPYSQPFDATTIPTGWTTNQNPAHEDSLFDWQFGTDFTTGSQTAPSWDFSPALDGNYAILNNGARDLNVRGDYKDLDLISPNFALVEGAMVFVQFKHFFYYENDAVGTLSYSTNDGADWQTLATYTTRSFNADQLNYTIEGLNGASQIKFKWNYTGGLNWGWAIDDVSVAESDTRLWIGGVDSDWENVNNWNPTVLPGSNTTAIIPDDPTPVSYPVITGSATSYKLIMDPNTSLTISSTGNLTVHDEFAPAGLTIESDATGTGSVIAGSVSGTLPSTIKSYLGIANRWYNISSPVGDQSVGSFLNTNTDIPLKETDKRGMMDFNTTTNAWNDYFTASAVESFQYGKGYNVRTNPEGTVTFTGAITAGTVNVPLSRDNLRWNLVGNPYTSAVNVTDGANSFLNQNASVLPPAYTSVYVWFGIEIGYVTVNYATFNAQYGQVAQGFFVKANTGSGNLIFTPEMQVHDNLVALKSGTVIPEIKLEVAHSDKTTSTQIKFIEKMTTGLDVGYDAGILKADPDFALFTRLVKDNNIEFMLQCLPMPSKETMVIPVGLDFRDGGEITFSAKMLNLPEESTVIFEDRELKKFTTFDKANSEYKAMVTANAEPTGRFYVHVSGKSQVTAIDSEANLKKINAWMEGNEMVISGTAGNNTVIRLFDIQGRSVLTRNLERTSVNRVNVSGINPGIYMLQVIENGKRTGIKLNISGN